MAKTSISQPLIFSNFSGGIAPSSRLGLKGSFANAQGLDFRTDPSQISVLPGLTRADNGVAKDLVLNEVMASNGVIYAYGDAGYIYRCTPAEDWSVIDKLNSGTAGIDYRKDTDAIYLTSNKTASRIGTVVNGPNPTLNPDYYADSISTYNNSNNAGFNVNADQEGSTSTTAILVATVPLNESDATRRYFQTDIEPLDRISVYVVNKGTGDWTLTLQDGINNILATATIINANLTNNSWADFVFSSAPNGQVRVYPAPDARTYHFHVTSTVADGSVSSSQTNNLSSCDVRVYADRFVQTNNGWHPAQRFQQYETFGNGNYLSVWEPITDPPTNAEWLRHRLVFPEEYEVCGLTLQNESEVIAAEKNTTLNTSVPQEGMLFFWDGLSDTYNYNVPIPEGTPYALHTYKNVVYYYAGGNWWAITSPTTQPVKQRQMPGTSTEFSGASSPVVVYPYAATVRRGIQLLGWPGSVANTDLIFGIYSWGATDKNFPETLGYNYQLSTGSQNYSAANNLRIGMTQSFGDTLHVSWRDDLSGGYGVDAITNSSKPAPVSFWQSLIFDAGYASKFKTANYVEAYYDIPDGATITLAWSIDGGPFVSDSTSYSTTTLFEGLPHYARFYVTNDNGGRFHEIQVQVTVTCDITVTVAPEVQEICLVYQPNVDELVQ